ncbi:UNVERIFIED_CONTAM: hypothetical protein RMT77_015289 [Armadillidium vulgare]
MILMRTIKKCLKFRQRSKCHKQLWTSTNYLRYDNGLAEENEKTDFSVEHKAYAEFFKRGKTLTPNVELFRILSEVFEIGNEKSIKKYILYERKLSECSNTQIKDTALRLRELNVSVEHLNLAPWLLLLTKEKIETRKSLIKKPYLFKKYVDGIGFTIFDPELILTYNKTFEKEDKEFDPFRNRIYYIGGRLKIPVDFLTLKLSYVWQVLHIQKKNIDLIIDLLLEFKYKPSDILKDVTVFRCNYARAKDRLCKMREIKGRPLPNFWIFRCSDSQFEKIYLEEKKYENCFGEDRVLVLMEELKINKEDSLELISKGHLETIQPKLIRYKIAKYKEAGLSNQDIIMRPVMLMYSEERLIKRIKYLRELGFMNLMDINIYNLVSSDILFERYVQQLSKKREINLKFNN